MTPRRRGPAAVVEPITFGTAELVPDRARPGGRTLYVDGVPQSYVDLDDPTFLEFEYVRRLAAVVDASGPAGAPLRVLHLGGGALTLPRYVAATRPGSHQRVVERDEALIALVRRELPLPRGADIRIRAGDARTVVESLAPGRFDLVVADVYQGAAMPRTVASLEFARQVARVLTPAGRYAVNVADLPPLSFTRRQTATLAACFPDVCVIAEPGMLRGRRYGNVILVADRQPGGLPVERLAAEARRDAFPGRVLHGEDREHFTGGARPVTDATARDSPAPPPGLFD